jgi:hypothetical protein
MLPQILRDQFKLLTFQRIKPDLRQHYWAYLAYGLFVTWVAGIGRYWDNPKAEWWQTLGLGSLAYVFLLAALLWIVIAPLKPQRWAYRDVLLFLTLTSLPAWLYAIPVELFMPLKTAQDVNALFLLVVATWRVALLVVYLKRAAGLSGWAILVATLLPLVLIVTSLAILNLEHVVFNIMAGNDATATSSNDLAYSVIFLMTIFSWLAMPVLCLAYVFLIGLGQKRAMQNPEYPQPSAGLRRGPDETPSDHPD